MTNKLRSVIEEWKEKVEKELGFFYSSSDSDFYLLLTMQLDAIIEEMEEDYRTDSGKGGIVMCLSPVLYAQIQKLKQAREELSNSLTQ